MTDAATRRALIFGASGQVGHHLMAAVPAGWTVVGVGSADVDVRDRRAVLAGVQLHRPDLVFNAAAYTAVDAAEASAELATQINGAGAAHIAEAACSIGARVVYLSSDYVFDGVRRSPYLPSDEPHPLNVYGRSKLAGEQAVRRIAGTRGMIVRTAWVYSSRPGNFVRTMLQRLGERAELGVVADQVGAPTWARPLADVLWALAARPELSGVLHWTDGGTASWHEFAIAIRDEAYSMGLLDRAIPVHPLTTSEYPTAARRPAFSVLSTVDTCEALGIAPEHWRVNLQRALLELRSA